MDMENGAESSSLRIDTVKGRSQLTPRREPYWHKIGTGFFVGFRLMPRGAGSWIARLRDADTGKQAYRALKVTADGKEAFSEAVRAAEEWRKLATQGVTSIDLTVQGACDRYIENLRQQGKAKTADDAAGRFRRLITDTPMASRLMRKLRQNEVKTWFYDQTAHVDPEDLDAIRAARASANRNLATLKAAFNLCADEGLILRTSAWAVAPYTSQDVSTRRGIGGNREAYLKAADRAALVNAAGPYLGAFLQGLYLTSARPGELAKCTVADFDPDSGSIRIATGKTGYRIVALPTEGVQFFKKQTAGRIGLAPLLTMQNGKHWHKDAWKDAVKAAAKAAGLPDDVVAYSMRHAAISERVSDASMSIHTIAKLAGTSVAMIEKHYGHLNNKRTREQLDAAHRKTG